MKPIVLFICLGNSCRSIMAEALARQFFGSALAAASAGIQPLGYIARETLQVLAEAGIPTSGLRSKGLKEMDLEACRLLVNLSGHSLAARMPAPLLERVLQRRWSIPTAAALRPTGRPGTPLTASSPARLPTCSALFERRRQPQLPGRSRRLFARVPDLGLRI